MDEDIRKIIEKVFSTEDGKVVEKMLELVNKEISDSGRAKRLSGLDYILSGAIK